MKKYVLLSMFATAFVGCGGVEESPELEGQEDVAGEYIAPVIQEDETGRVIATGANCRVELRWCKAPTTGQPDCVDNGQCSSFQRAVSCAALIARIC